MAGLVNDATLARIASEPSRPFDWRSGGDPAVADVVADRFGAQVVARSVDPMLGGVYAGSAATIGLRSAAPTLAAALDGGAANLTEAVRGALLSVTAGPVFGAVSGGYTVLVDELARRGRPTWVQSAVQSIEPAEQGWTLNDDSGGTWHADAVVLAVPAARLAGLVKTIAPPTAAAAGRIISASSVVVALALPRGINFPQNSGVLVASGEPLHAKAITLSSRKWGRGSDVELLRLSFGRLGDDIAARASDEKLLSWAIEDLAAVFGLAVEPVDVRVQRWPDAMPQYGPGHRDLVDELRAGLPATLTVAGSYLDGIGVPACVGVAGRAAAAAVLAVESSVAR
jgi:oxygen-dependent protoporphyrinogen oxidase